MTSNVNHLWECVNSFFRIGIPTQRQWTNDNTQILSEILQFFWQEQIQKIKLFKYYTEKEKKMDKIVIIRTGTYL